MAGRNIMDEQAYKEKELRQMRPGQYHVHASEYLPNTRALIPDDKWIRPQITGSIVSSTVPPVEIESDLRGLDRPTSRAPASFTRTYESINIMDSYNAHHTRDRDPIVGEIMARDVHELRSTDSRLGVPALALRGLTPNRFHPNLLHNPAETVMAPFDRLVSSRIVMKDQWRVPSESLVRVRPPTIPGRIASH